MDNQDNQDNQDNHQLNVGPTPELNNRKRKRSKPDPGEDADDEASNSPSSSGSSSEISSTSSSELENKPIKRTDSKSRFPKRVRKEVDYKELHEGAELDLDDIYEEIYDDTGSPDHQPKDVKSMVKRIVQSADEKDNVYSAWKKNLTKAEISNLEPLFKKLLQEFKKKDIDELDIVKSNLSLEEKIECYELLRIIRSQLQYYGETSEWLKMRIKLFDRVKRANIWTDQDRSTIKKLEDINQHSVSLKYRIIRSGHPDEIKAKIYRRYNEVKDLKHDDESRGKTLEWVNKALQLPTELVSIGKKYNSSMDLIHKVYHKMDQYLYGQSDAKEKIIDIVSAMWVNPESSNKSIVFVGPPGVGKTMFASSLAETIGLPFYQISFGGAKDSSVLKGDIPAYVGSKPGEIVEGLIKMQAKNGILFLDELDKIDEGSVGGRQVSNTLLHILDYSQNKQFKDLYIGDIPIDLSNLIIIISVNDTHKLNRILLDRLQLIKFKPYILQDKIAIGYDYIVPRVLKNLKLDPLEVKTSRSIVEYIITKSQIHEQGVRQLERNLRTIYERINTLKQIYSSNNPKKRIKLSYDIPNFSTPCTLTKPIVDVLFREYSEED